MTTGARVLIVDDASFMRGLISDAVVRSGHQVAGEARDGREAVERYAELRPDLVTLDITMPGSDGLEALATIRRIDGDARVLMCSALGQDRKMLEAARLGAKGFLVKPFTPEGIIAEIAIALRG